MNHLPRKHSTLALLSVLSIAAAVNTATDTPPVPSPQQLAWQRHEFIAFAHFGMNTFTDREWGDGREDPKLFNPSEFDAKQSAAVLQEAGVKLLILTAKHHDGFCLWPSQFTEHCVKNSPWRGGQGDVVREVVEALAKSRFASDSISPRGIATSQPMAIRPSTTSTSAISSVNC